MWHIKIIKTLALEELLVYTINNYKNYCAYEKNFKGVNKRNHYACHYILLIFELPICPQKAGKRENAKKKQSANN